MTKIVHWLDRKLYPSSRDNWDDHALRNEILKRITPDSILLDLGAGAGIVDAMNFRGLVREAVGVDPDERVKQNPHLDEGRVGVGEQLPCASNSIDVVIADNVLEHLAEPLPVFREIARVLRPGGFFLFKTPNRMHYMPLIARLTPHRFHQIINRWRGRAEVDTFPTLYRVNSERDLAAVARQAGLSIVSVDFIEGRPEYLRMTPPTYLAGALYERIVNRFAALRRFRVIMIGTLQKPHAAAQAVNQQRKHDVGE